jgi:hypothetical protein
MARFQVSLARSDQGDILVNGTYISGSEPLFVERVVLEELDSQGNTVGASTHRISRTIDPVQGSSLLVSKTPFGTNVTAARATAYYMEIDKTAKSGTINL